MVFKGLLVVVSGFLFIFASGIPMRLIARFRPDYKRDGIYWGVIIWIFAFFLSTFLLIFFRMVISGSVNVSSTSSAWPFLLGTLFTTLLVQVGLFIYLRNKKKKNEDLVESGMAVGFGVGFVIAQILTGVILITTGAVIAFQSMGITLPSGIIQEEMLEKVVSSNLFELIPALLSFILYRVAVLAICSAQGYLIAKSIEGKKSNFWLALIGYTSFVWINLLVQKLLSEPNLNQISLGLTSPLTSVASAVYYLGVFILVYRWLSGELLSANKKGSKARS
jgi:hypothetical protein